MFLMRNSRFTIAAIAGAILACAHTGLLAEEQEESSEDDEDVIEEIIVYANKRSDRIDVDARYEELFDSLLKKDLERLRELEEDYEWRKPRPDVRKPTRITWGYDPDTELRMRRNTELTDLPIDDVKPATLFRFEF